MQILRVALSNMSCVCGIIRKEIKNKPEDILMSVYKTKVLDILIQCVALFLSERILKSQKLFSKNGKNLSRARP